jgi:hypothetical protein
MVTRIGPIYLLSGDFLGQSFFANDTHILGTLILKEKICFVLGWDTLRAIVSKTYLVALV